MLENLENMIETYLEKTPFIANIFLGYETKILRQSLNESKRLRETYEPTEQWYIAYGNNFNIGCNALYNAVDRTYAAYDAMKNIPLIGEPICNLFEGYIGNMIYQPIAKTMTTNQNNINNQSTIIAAPKKFHIPQKTTTLKAVESIANLGIEGICAHYESTTGKSADNIRDQITYTPTTYEIDPSPFRRCFIDALESIGNFFNELFGDSSYDYTLS